MSTKIWQVPNKSKSMAKVFARKSGEQDKGQHRKPSDKIDWRKEYEDEHDPAGGN